MRMQKITLNLVPEGEKPIVYASQFDNDRVIRFDLKDGEEDYAYSGTEAFEVAIRKPDDHLVTLEAEKDSETITVDDEPVTVYFVKVALDENSCACFGESICELKIMDGEALIGSLNFVLDVERSPELNGITSTDGIHNLTTQIEDITSEVVGENYYDKEEIDDKFDDLDIPTKTSQLTNDSGFVMSSDIPTKTSQLTNDSGFVTSSDIPTKTSQLTNDSGFVTSSDIPTKTSQLTNDSGFVTIDDNATVNDKTWSSNKIMEEIINILPNDTVTGDIATFKTSIQIPLLKANITLPVSVNGISNILLTKYTGINVWDEEWELGAYSNTTGEPVERNDRIRSKNPIRVKPSSTYYLKYYNTPLVVIRYNSNDEFLYISSMSDSGLVTTNGDTRYIRFYLVDNTYNNNISLNYPSSDTDYHAFNGTTQLISFTNPIYDGADVNLLTGDVTINTSPVTHDSITPMSITPYLGENNIYSNIGQTSVTYKQSINDLLSP